MGINICVKTLRELLENKVGKDTSSLSDMEILSFVYSYKSDDIIKEVVEVKEEWEVNPNVTFAAILNVKTSSGYIDIAIEGRYRFKDDKIVDQAIEI